MPKTEAEIAADIARAKQDASTAANRRKILYAESEMAMVARDHKMQCLGLFCSIMKKYNIEKEDIIALLETVPYI